MIVTVEFLLGVTSENRLKIGVYEVSGPVWSKISGTSLQRIVRHQPLTVSENVKNGPFIWYKNVGRSFFRFNRIYAFGRQTDKQVDISAVANTALHSMQRRKND